MVVIPAFDLKTYVHMTTKVVHRHATIKALNYIWCSKKTNQYPIVENEFGFFALV